MNESSQRVSTDSKTKDARTSRCPALIETRRDRKSHEQASDKRAARPQLNSRKLDVQPKDTIAVERLNRLGLNVDDLAHQTGRPDMYVQKDVLMS